MASSTHRDGSGRTAPHQAGTRRRTDRVEEAAATVLRLGTVVAVLVIGLFALSVYRGGSDRAVREAADRTQVVAVATADAPVPPAVRGGGTLPRAVPAVWSTPDGRSRAGDVRVTDRPRAGEEIPLWVDAEGRPVAAPMTTGTAVWVALADAAVLLLLLGYVVRRARAGVRAATFRINARAWEREWAEVEPRWSGRPSAG
ncbi:MAG: hypothetical protein OJJ54_02180 [Pseudonocardia sp.]|nr:hypothetical protein [Pseudonocardia sp.]